jgi:curved DNA-binding protein CbpA
MDPYRVLNVSPDCTLKDLLKQYNQMLKRVHPNNGGSEELYNMVVKSYKTILQSMDPYRILDAPRHCTVEQLRDCYKMMALYVHPDKGGSAKLFQLVTECYKALLNDHYRSGDRDFYDLKQEASRHYQQNPQKNQQTRPQQPTNRDEQHQRKPHIPQEKTNLIINQLFEKHKLESVYDAGYGHMMASSSAVREDIDIPQTITNAKHVNDHFQRHIASNSSKEIAVYKEPEALLLAKCIQFTELDQDAIDDFSGQSKQKNLQYSDYMKAHTTSYLIDPRTVKERPTFQSVDEYTAYRDMNNTMTPEELGIYQSNIERERLAEEQRVYRMKQQERLYEDYNRRVNQAMLQYS